MMRYLPMFLRWIKASWEKIFIFGKVEKWDSVAHLNLISELEDTFDTMLETEDILHYGSYLNGLEILRRNGVEI